MTTLHVTCAIIEYEGRVLAAQRSATMSLPLKWEFPGGKIDDNESPDQCILRELKEELNIDVEIIGKLENFKHGYPEFEVIMYPYICLAQSKSVSASEHAKVCWLTVDELKMLDWAEADIPIVKTYLESYL